MIKHEILVVKEEKPRIPFTYFPSFNRPHIPWYGAAMQPEIRNQQELNNYMNDCPFNVGDWVTYKTYMKAPNIGAIAYILAREVDFNNLKVDHKGKAKAYCLVSSAFLPGVSPWRRWDTINDFRKISDDEFLTHVQPLHDKLQNHISEERALFIKDPTRWRIQ